jgi:pyridoxamine 5'-phosphate oxidase
MSSNTSHTAPSSTAPWKPTFTSHLELAGGVSAEFVLGTVTPDHKPSSRYCIHRGFWASLPENSHNQLPKNAKLFDSDCPVFTTDARMSKVYDIFATGRGKGTLEQSRSGSGGGGPVEAVYWIKDISVQWRIRGQCWLVAADDIEGGTEAAQNSGTVTVKAQLGRYMRPAPSTSEQEAERQRKDWSWRLEVENWFENLSPMMRGSFKNPPPGVPKVKGTETDGEKLGQKGGHLAEEELARKNFRVAVIAPTEVEQVDLSDPAEAKRWVWKLRGAEANDIDEDVLRPVGEWDMVELWP